MLLSLVVRLQALQPGVISAAQGYALYDVFLREWLGSVDAGLAQSVHDEKGLKSFTLSTLSGAPVNRRGEMLLKPGQEVCFRITTLSRELSSAVMEKLLIPQENPVFFSGTHIPLALRLADQPFQILEVTADPARHSEAGRATYEELFQKNMMRARPPGDDLCMEFTSPTSFHSHGKQQVFPLPEMVFRSWLERWNNAIEKWEVSTSLRFPPETLQFVAQNVVVSRYDLHTETMRYGEELHIGFSGRCTFHLLESDPYWQRVLLTLAAYAFYCGTGHKTTIGLGQTRCLL